MLEALYNSPLGPLTLVAENAAITALDWRCPRADLDTPNDPLLLAASAQLDAYFKGQVITFDLPLKPAGSALVRRVCAAMQTIPYGQTVTYGAIATTIGSGPRAVGGACGRNPIPIIIPCHRVLGGSGKLTGFSGLGGLATKKWLLELEQGAPQFNLVKPADTAQRF
jgi:methylated-DNA-[protein]-cysteine S-methyltransferase